MPLFISDEEFQRCSGDAGQVAEKADAYIQKLNAEIEKVKSDAAAASITLEQSCFDIEQKYVSLSTEHALLQSKYSEQKSVLEQRDSEVARVQSEKQQLLLQSIEKDGEIERLRRGASEFHSSKRQLIELLENKDLEVSGKHATMKSYLDKIANLTENATSKEVRLADLEFELGQSKAASARLLQEKELLETHNAWLNEELAVKVNSLIQLRQEYGELEADLSSKLAHAEKRFEDNSSSLKLQKDRVKQLEEKLASLETELSMAKNAATAAEKSFSAEISTVNKLVELYKESSEEWSKKAGDLEGLIKALEVHLSQVENENKEKLEKEVSLRMKVEKECTELKDQLQNNIAELEQLRKGNDRALVLSGSTPDLFPRSVDSSEFAGDARAIVPLIPAGISETALAASLLKDGWTLVKLYSKFQETSDALRHEQMGRKQAQAVLERVLYEVEKKAVAIFAEREEHERLLDAYSSLERKLQISVEERSSLETTIQDLKANLKRQDRDHSIAQKEIVDLQKQVAILLKECRDLQLRCGSAATSNDTEQIMVSTVSSHDENSMGLIISERLLTFKDIHSLVESNVQLRSLARKLSEQVQERESVLKDMYEKELQRHTEDAEFKVNEVLRRAEEQSVMIESLHNSVSLYKKLYEEEKLRFDPCQQDAVQDQLTIGVLPQFESGHDRARKSQNQAFERLKDLEEDLDKLRNEATSLRSERDKLAVEVSYEQEKYSRFLKEFEQRKEEHNRVLARNIEFQQLIVDYQNKMRESARSLDAANDLSSKLQMEVSILKHEKEIIQNSEKRASDEVRSLAERCHRLQATLETIHATDEAREEARSSEKKQRESYINKIEREWAEVKQELQEERDSDRNLSVEREATLRNALRQIEDLRKELAYAMQSAATVEAKAAVAEARTSDLEKILESRISKSPNAVEAGTSSSEQIMANIHDELEKMRDECQASKGHMLQYKNLAQVNEEACKQMELAYESLKNEAEEVKRSLEAELVSLRNHVRQLEDDYCRRIEEAISATSEKEEALFTAMSEISSLKNDCSVKTSRITLLESQISSLREDLREEHARWQSAKENYERQVVLQSETIKELTETSNALASAQEELSELRKAVDALKVENNGLNSKWETEKLAIETYKKEADNRYTEVDELNKTLLSRLETLHVKFVERDQGVASENTSKNSADEKSMLNVVNYLRRTKEISETEISLLKQERLRLQAQLESALKSAEAAQASISAERAKSRASLFSDEDFKSLQLQVRELNLLRESNAQLREENKHNFEECLRLREALQNAKIEMENLEKLLREKGGEFEAYRQEHENLKVDKANLEQRIDEVMNRYKEIDVDEYRNMKEASLNTVAALSEKDSQIEDLKKLLSEKQDAIALLEQNLAKSSAELSDREARIKELLQAQASLKTEIERGRRLIAHRKRLEKEKEDLAKEKEAMSKELEAARLGSAGEQVQREKEKDTRIQMLEKIVERLREDLKKEKDDHNREKDKVQKTRRTVFESREAVLQQKRNLSAELDKHREALKLLEDEVENLKQGQSDASMTHASSNVLEDFASAYYRAVENFAQVAQTVCNEQALASDAGAADNSSNVQSVAASNQAVLPTLQTSTEPTTLPRTADEKEKSTAAAKPTVKAGRRLMRPNLVKPRGLGDVEMPEADDSTARLSSQVTETQANTSMPATALIRKRPSPSLPSDVQENTPAAAEEPSPDIAAPPQKKSKAIEESPPESGEETPAAPAVLSDVVDIAEPMEDDGNPQHEGNEESLDAREEVETAWEQPEEPAVDEEIQVELLREMGEAMDDPPENSTERMASDDQTRDQTEQEIQQIVPESDEREEGEMASDFDDNEGDDNTSREEIRSPAESVPEQSLEIPKNQEAEIEPLEAPDTPETIVDAANKLDSSTPATPETGLVPETSIVTAGEAASTVTQVDAGGSSEQGRPDSGVKPASPVNSIGTTINLQERARERAQFRQAGMGAAPSQSRGRGRAPGRVARGRPARGRAGR